MLCFTLNYFDLGVLFTQTPRRVVNHTVNKAFLFVLEYRAYLTLSICKPGQRKSIQHRSTTYQAYLVTKLYKPGKRRSAICCSTLNKFYSSKFLSRQVVNTSEV